MPSLRCILEVAGRGSGRKLNPDHRGGPESGKQAGTTSCVDAKTGFLGREISLLLEMIWSIFFPDCTSPIVSRSQ